MDRTVRDLPGWMPTCAKTNGLAVVESCARIMQVQAGHCFGFRPRHPGGGNDRDDQENVDHAGERIAKFEDVGQIAPTMHAVRMAPPASAVGGSISKRPPATSSPPVRLAEPVSPANTGKGPDPLRAGAKVEFLQSRRHEHEGHRRPEDPVGEVEFRCRRAWSRRRHIRCDPLTPAGSGEYQKSSGPGGGCDTGLPGATFVHPRPVSPNQINELQPIRPMSISADQCSTMPPAAVDYLVHQTGVYTSPVSDGMLG